MTSWYPRQEVRNILADIGLSPQNREEKFEAIHLPAICCVLFFFGWRRIDWRRFAKYVL